MSKIPTSLYTKIIKKENNALVIRDIVIDGLNPYMRRIIKALVEPQIESWAKEKIFIADLQIYIKNPESYSSRAVFEFDKLKSFIVNPPENLEKLTDAELSKLQFTKLDLNDLDTAGIIKVLAHRMPRGVEFIVERFKSVRAEINKLRNTYEGHLNENRKTECSSEILVEKTNILASAFMNSTNSFDGLIRNCPKASPEHQTLHKCRQQMLQARAYLLDVVKTVEDITSCKIIKDSAIKYTAEDLIGYNVFVVYPDARSDKFRRFCNDSLRVYHALKGDYIYTDTGTISRLEAYSQSKDPERRFEAKQIQKTLFEPMQRGNTLKVLSLTDKNEIGGEEDFIDISAPRDEEIFLSKIQQVEGNICVITDDIEIADKIWQFNANKDIKNFSAVAVRVVDKINVKPFYK